jgi:glutamate-ammonia-ligase adenylyltransferase
MSLGDAAPGREDGSLARHLDRHREIVRTFYDSVLGRAAQLMLGEGRPNPWLDRVDDAVLLETLRTAGVREPERVLVPLKSMRRLLRPEAVSEEFRQALRRNGPHLLQAAVRTRHPRRALGNVEKLFSSLLANPGELLHFLNQRRIIVPTIQLLGRSDFLAGLVIRQPGILRSFEQRSSIMRTPRRETYRSLLLRPARGDVHHGLGELRRRHQAALATIALRDINRQATLREVLKSLSDLADATVDAVEMLAREELAEGGHPVPDSLRIAILGLGRLGYRELDYGSDLDLVFLQEGGAGRTLEGRSLATRLCEAMVRQLSTLSRDGQLYHIDLRLRPSGGAGELVHSIASLGDYIRDQAETWELQSFLKARPVGGDRELGRRGGRTIESLLLDRAQSLGAGQLAGDILVLRRRLADAAGRDRRRPDIKQGDGGLLDIHFLIEYLQLSHRIANPDDKDTLRLLTILTERGALDEGKMSTLYEGYLFLRALDHEMRLIHHPPLKKLPADEGRRRELAEGLDPSTINDPGAGRKLLETYRRHATAIHGTYQAIVRAGN